MKKKDWIALVGFIVLSQAAGVLGSFFTVSEIGSWYSALVVPEFSPPGWIFGPVWTTLYTLMGIAAFLVWRKGYGRRDVRGALRVFLLQLALNALWSIIFFGLHSVGGAFVEIVALLLAIVATIIVFARVSRPAAWLLAPYVLWVSFAAYLNFSIWRLNI